MAVMTPSTHRPVPVFNHTTITRRKLPPFSHNMISAASLLQSPCKTLLFSIGDGNGFLACAPFTTRLLARTTRSFSKTSSRRRLPSHGVVCALLPVDPWAPSIDSQSIASQLFAFSLFPYLGFLYFITKSKTSPRLTLFGFYFLLAFVGATMIIEQVECSWSGCCLPAGIYAKVHYGTSLSNVDWLHGGAESLLTLTNLFVVLGLRNALRKIKNGKKIASEVVSEVQEQKTSVEAKYEGRVVVKEEDAWN
ncbi:hypothetical protein DsansV1_C23g0178411 [Dioscorea sansibarensis]